MSRRSLILLMIFLNISIYAEMQSILLPELVNPDAIAVDQTRLFITQGTSIYIYDLTNFKLMKKLGRPGEGPREFMIRRRSGDPPLSIDVKTDEIVVNSVNKVSYFTKDGVYKRELKVKGSSIGFIPFLKGFVGETMVTEEGKRYRQLMVYDQKMNKTKDLCRIEHHFQGVGKGFKVLKESRLHKVDDGKLYVTWGKDFNIDVYNFSGEKIDSISYDYSKKAVSPKAKKEIIKYFKTHSRMKEIYPLIKPLIIPDYYPALRDMFIDAGKIYAVTWNKTNSKTECLVLVLKGKLIETLYVNLISSDIFDLYPYTIRNDKVYQIVETDEEEWKLNVNKIQHISD